MPGIVVQIKPVEVVMVGIEFMQFGNHYLAAAERLEEFESDDWFDPLPYQLLCQSLELHLKSFIWLKDRSSRTRIKKKYGHDLEKLWWHAKSRGISRYCSSTPLREQTISLVSPYYRQRKFVYLDLLMSFEGIPNIRRFPKAKITLSRLCRKLKSSLKKPILNAS